MAEKISINIDLSSSRRVEHQDDGVSYDKIQKQNINKGTVEYKYRYDRIFMLVVFIVVILLITYLLFSGHEETLPQTSVEQPVKQRHLSVPENKSIKPQNHAVYLFYETINVLDRFYFPIEQQESEEHQNLVPEPEPVTEETRTNLVPNGIKIDLIKAQKIKSVTKEERDVEIIKAINDAEFININSKNLSRVLLAGNIYKKEPVNELSYYVFGYKDSAKKVYLFTQIDNSVGQTIEHQWWYHGKLIANKKFTIRGKRWRCYSSKNIGHLQQGKWLAKVLDQKGSILSTVNFQYIVN